MYNLHSSFDLFNVPRICRQIAVPIFFYLGIHTGSQFLGNLTSTFVAIRTTTEDTTCARIFRKRYPSIRFSTSRRGPRVAPTQDVDDSDTCVHLCIISKKEIRYRWAKKLKSVEKTQLPSQNISIFAEWNVNIAAWNEIILIYQLVLIMGNWAIPAIGQ